MTASWYCGHKCPGCNALKCKQLFRGERRDTRERCETCQFPICEECGRQYAEPKPIAPMACTNGIWKCPECLRSAK